MQWKKKERLCGRSSYFRLISSGRFMKITFKSDNSVQRKGFLAMVRKTCGGVMTDPDGVIYSDNYPEERGYSICSWLIRLKPGRKIKITFDNFLIANQSNHCNDAYLLIYNGGSNDSPFLGQGRFCGRNTMPVVPESSSNQVYIVFRIPSRHIDRRFHLTYQEITAGCGGHHHLSEELKSIEITSPNYPHPPHPHSECVWIITGPPMKTLSLKFKDTFDIGSEYDANCDEAYVEVRDGGSKLSERKLKTCGNQIPNPVRSSSSTMYIRYYTNAQNVHTGFKAEIDIESCGGTYYVQNGYLASRNYPNPYDSNMNCTWNVIGPIGHYMSVRFTEVNIFNPGINCSMEYGRLSVLDPITNNTVTYCDEGVSHPSFESAGNNITITFTNFKSEGSVNRYKLYIISSREVCGGQLSGSEGVIQSPGYPHGVAHVRHCTWEIRGPPGSKISLILEDLSIHDGNKCLGHLRVYNGIQIFAPPITPYYCSISSQKMLNSSMNQMKIQFYTFRPVYEGGFRATWSSEYEQDCGGQITENEGIIISPEYGSSQDFSPSIFCAWTLSNPSPTNASMRFILDENHLANRWWNIIYIYGYDPDGQVIWEKIIYGGNNEVDVILPYPQIKIFYQTSRPSNTTGFKMRFETYGCGGYRTGPQDVIQSPGYNDGGYPSNSECSWIFSYAEGSQIEYRFLDFNLEKSLNHDFVKIYNGESIESPLIGHYSGTGPSNRDVGPSMSNKLLTVFKSDGSTNARGFKAMAKEHTAGCGGIFHGMNGTFSSPGFSENADYPINTECQYKVVSPPGYQIKLSFIEAFDLENSENCGNDFVQVSVKGYNQSSESWTEQPKKCGKQAPSPLQNISSSVKVLFRSNNAIQGKGFKVLYEASCGGVYTAPEGILVSPNYPDRYPNNISCQYDILAGSQAYITLNFTSFDIYSFRYIFPARRRRPCVTDKLLIQQKRKNYFRRNTKMITKYTLCGSTLPEPVTLRGPVRLKFITLPWMPNRFGFSLKYRIKECGGNITQPGVVELPTGSGRYLNHMNCIWDIKAPEGKVAYIKFQSLVLEYHYRCQFDNLKIYDGFNQDENNLIQSFCGNHTEYLPVLTSKSSRTRIVFSSDRFAGHRDGLRFAVDFTYKCGGIVNISQADSTQIIRSLDADGDGNYENLLQCKWLVLGHPDMIVALNFTRMSIEGPNENDTEACPYDSVKIYDGKTENSELNGVFCGSSMPQSSILGLTHFMLIVFESDSVNTSAGFTATIGNVPLLCGAKSIEVTNQTQVLQSPNFPAHYPVSVRCMWILYAPDDQRIQMHFDDFKLEYNSKCTKDQVQVVEYEGENEHQIIKNGPNSARWRYSYTLLLNSGSDTWVSFPYTSDLNTIFCGNQDKTDLNSNTNKIKIKFVSDSATTASGFRMHYQLQSCNTTYRGISGHISSTQNGPVYCYTTITAEQNRYITLYVDSLFYRGYRRVTNQGPLIKVYDGTTTSSNSIFEASGLDYNFHPVFSTGNSLFVRLNTTRYSFTYNIHYYTSDKPNGCGGSVFGNRNYLFSPNYGEAPGQNLTCTYAVSVPHNYQAYFALLNNDLYTPDCNSTYFELYNVLPSNEASLFTRFCPGDSVARHISPSNRLILRFITGPEQVNGTGWRAFVTRGTRH